MPAIKVLIVDDYRVLLPVAQRTLGAMPDVTVVGAASSGEVALSFAQIKPPHVILLEVNMPGMDGPQTTLSQGAEGATARIVFISPGDAPDAEARALDVAPAGFIPKADFAAEVQRVIARL